MNDNGVSLKISGLKKSWDAVEVLKGIDLEIEAGTFLSLLGPSGCGKSSALRLIAGLDDVSSGTIEIGGRDVTNLPPIKRNIGMVFQNYALFPHMSVRQNVLYGMRVRGHSRVEQETGLKRVAELMNLGPLLERKPAQLSGGQQQRVALARVLISNRPLVLMDEPLSNLDAKLRAEIRSEIKDLNRQLGITIVYVTHDQSEALSMSDKVMLMGNGEAIQFGTPEDLFKRPASIAVAHFIGTPPMNVFGASLLPTCLARLGIKDSVETLKIGVRPEHLRLGSEACEFSFPARVLDSEYEGNLTIVRLAAESGEKISATLPSHTTPAEGARVHVGCDLDDIRLFRSSDGKSLVETSYASGKSLAEANSI